MVRVDVDFLNLDETLALPGTLDYSEYMLYLDMGGSLVLAVCDVSAEVANKVAVLGDIEIVARVEFSDSLQNELDLLPLLPAKFRSLTLMQDLVSVLSKETARWMDLTAGLGGLIDVNNCPDDFIPLLGQLVNVNLEGVSDYSEMRRRVRDAVPFYKVKGSYNGIWFITPYTTAFTEMYAIDATAYNAGNFQTSDWEIERVPGVLPSGITTGSYKTPHMGVFLCLDTIIDIAGTDYLLFADDRLLEFKSEFIRTKPVMVFPHFGFRLTGGSRADGVPVIGPGGVMTRSLPAGGIIFDDSPLKICDDTPLEECDLGSLSSPTRWITGTLTDGSFAPGGSTHVFNTAPQVVNIANGIKVIFTIEGHVLTGVTQIGVYSSSTQIIALNFPPINLTSVYPLRVEVTVTY